MPATTKPRLSVRRFQEAIHDDLGPRLFSVATKLSLLKAQLAGKERRRVSAILQEVEATRLQVSRLARGVDQEAAGDLEAALKGIAREVKGRFDNQLNHAINQPVIVDCLYRIAREAAHNAVRHGRARRIVIRLAAGRLSVEDNGVGMAEGWEEGMGIKLMKRRARQMGGRLTLHRVAPGRTVLACHFPMSRE